MPNLVDFCISQRPPARYVGRMQSIGQRASTAWTAQEDQLLMNARAQGLNWAPIQQAHFPGKTPNACRKRHERLMERRSAEDWDAEKFQTLAKEYQSLRKDMWTMLGNRVGEKWQLVEAKCMEKGLKNIQSAGRSANRRDRLASGMHGVGPGDCDSELDVEGGTHLTEGHDVSDEETQRGVKRMQSPSEHPHGRHHFDAIIR
ncbi:MAG: hypothetical protein M1833_004423 [Piccolia ochrophora]|nr:MAG: hypothetical protein M1833_004423 [Piccolia ochrophora]